MCVKLIQTMIQTEKITTKNNITSALDELVQKNQTTCDHFYQDRLVTEQGVFCGNCSQEIV